MSQSQPLTAEATRAVLTIGRSRRPSGSRAWSAVVLVLAVLYFFLPLVGTASFALSTGKVFTLQPLLDALADPDAQGSILLSLGFAVATTVVTVAIVAPSAYLVELRLPRLRSLLDFVTILPFVIPPIILTLGLEEVYGIHGVVNLVGSPVLLIGGYFALTLPFVYRAIDNALRAIDVRTLTEAAESLGAGPIRTFLRIIVPSISTGLLSAALLGFTTIMGEFTLASLMGYPTFPVMLNNTYASAAREAASLVLVAFFITWACVLALAVVSRRSPAARAVATAR
ncbi:MAG TPA: ABC transporter permease subunit [Candidatus Limnocylindrales bacterium]